MNDNTYYFLNVLMLLVLVFSSIGLGYFGESRIKSFLSNSDSFDVVSPSECTNRSLEATSYCINRYVKSIYQYKVRDDDENPTFSELVSEGGDCLNWAELYKDYFDDLGFYTYMPIVDVNDEYAHTFLIASDESGYCILDQEHVECFKLITS